MKVSDFALRKQAGGKISMLTAYDYSFARLVDASPVDCVLVGDSAAMVMHGCKSTIDATPEMMAIHVAAVAKGAPSKFIVADMPFLSFRSGLKPAMDCAAPLLRAGAHAVKLEGIEGHEDVVRAMTSADIPVMGHLGLTPQSILKLGAYKVQGRTAPAAEAILEQAARLERAGCFALVLECVPDALAQRVTAALAIPTIGIGAGPHTDGQVLVLQDTLGFCAGTTPRFVKRYLDGKTVMGEALSRFDAEVKNGAFPQKEHSCGS